MVSLSRRVVGNDRQGPALDEELAKAVAVIGGVSGTQTGRRQWADQTCHGAHVTELAGGQFERDDPTEAVRDRVYLGRTPTTRSPDGLNSRPPFPPPADRCALVVVLSII